MKKLKYEGGRASIDVKLPSGRRISVVRGDTVEVNAVDSKALLVLPGWSKVANPITPIVTNALKEGE